MSTLVSLVFLLTLSPFLSVVLPFVFFSDELVLLPFLFSVFLDSLESYSSRCLLRVSRFKSLQIDSTARSLLFSILLTLLDVYFDGNISASIFLYSCISNSSCSSSFGTLVLFFFLDFDLHLFLLSWTLDSESLLSSWSLFSPSESFVFLYLRSSFFFLDVFDLSMILILTLGELEDEDEGIDVLNSCAL